MEGGIRRPSRDWRRALARRDADHGLVNLAIAQILGRDLPARRRLSFFFLHHQRCTCLDQMPFVVEPQCWDAYHLLQRLEISIRPVGKYFFEDHGCQRGRRCAPFNERMRWCTRDLTRWKNNCFRSFVALWSHLRSPLTCSICGPEA